jgi:hypothetical protein
VEYEEMEALIKKVSEELEQLDAEPEKSLSKKDRRRKVLLQARSAALDRIKKAKEKGTMSQEVKACMDYALLTEYGEKHPLLMNYMKSQIGWWGF